MLPIDRTAKSTLDTNLVNGNTSDAPVIKSSNDVVYNTIDELNAKVDTLISSGALVKFNSVYAKSASSTLLTSEVGIIEATTGASGISLTLPSAATSGLRYTLKKVDSAAGSLVVATTSAQTIDGTTTKTISKQYDTITVVSNGTSWDIVADGNSMVKSLGGGNLIQSGSTGGTVAVAGTAVNVSVTFPTTFPTTPKVFFSVTSIGASSATYITIVLSASSTTGFTINLNSGVAQAINFNWLAIGS